MGVIERTRATATNRSSSTRGGACPSAASAALGVEPATSAPAVRVPGVGLRPSFGRKAICGPPVVLIVNTWTMSGTMGQAMLRRKDGRRHFLSTAKQAGDPTAVFEGPFGPATGGFCSVGGAVRDDHAGDAPRPDLCECGRAKGKATS